MRRGSGRRGGEGDELLLAGGPAVHFGDRAAFTNDHHAMGEGGYLLQFARYQDDSHSLSSELANPAMNLGLCGDIDATSWLIEEHHLRLARQGSGDHDLLLITPG